MKAVVVLYWPLSILFHHQKYNTHKSTTERMNRTIQKASQTIFFMARNFLSAREKYICILSLPQRQCRDIFFKTVAPRMQEIWCRLERLRTNGGWRGMYLVEGWSGIGKELIQPQASWDFDWRNPTNPAIANLPRPLENDSKIKCYRNVIFIWLFHTQVLLNWIDDNHRAASHGRRCLLCRLRKLAARFWAQGRLLDTNFNKDVDAFWNVTHDPQRFPDLNQQNDAEEYMQSLLDLLHDRRWVYIHTLCD